MDTNKKRKLRTGVMAALLMMLILLTGTYAWTQFNNVGFGSIYTETNFGGRFHDHFEWYDETGKGDHTISLFAENFGDNTIFVRARLREFLRIGGAAAIGEADINDIETWPIYVSEPDDATVRRVGSPSYTIGNRGIEWNMGHPSDGKVFMPTFNHAQRVADDISTAGNIPLLYQNVRAFEMIEATGMAVDGVANLLNTNIADPGEIGEVSDILESGSQTGPGIIGHDATSGEQESWIAGDTMSSPILYVTEEAPNELRLKLEENGEPFEHEAKYTLTPDEVESTNPAFHITNGVITMQQWNEAGRPWGDFWVLDTDGWFYWSNPLPAKKQHR